MAFFAWCASFIAFGARILSQSEVYFEGFEDFFDVFEGFFDVFEGFFDVFRGFFSGRGTSTLNVSLRERFKPKAMAVAAGLKTAVKLVKRESVLLT
jgi:hypothetical protein